MSEDFSQIETEILVAKYGLDRVLKALAASKGRTLEELKNAIEERKRVSKPIRKEIDLEEIIKEVTPSDPVKANTLRTLATAYRNRTLFPTLKDIQTFLQKKSGAGKVFKDRKSATRPLFHELASLSISDLVRLEESSRKTERGDLHTLAQGILNK